MKVLATAILSTICASAAGQNYVHTEHEYTDGSGRGVIIQNSLPKGGGTYTDSTGRSFLYVIFWSRVVNETTTPLDLEIGGRIAARFYPIISDYIRLNYASGRPL